MSKIVSVACDTGNDTIKVKIGSKYYFVPTILKSNPGPRLVLGTSDDDNPVNVLDVSVEAGDISGHFHVGELANYGESQESFGGLKSDNKLLIVCMMTTIAYALAMEYPGETNFLISLGTGLPIHEFFWQDESGSYSFSKVISYRNKLAGKHQVKFNTALMNNKTITIEILKENITIIPEGYSALMSILMNKNVNPDFLQYTRKNLLAFCIDIGSITCDISAIMNARYFPAGMFGFDIGIGNALDRLCKDLRNRTGIKDITRMEINNYMFDAELNGIYTVGKESVDFKKEKLPYYQDLANNIAYRFREKLKDNGVDIRRIGVLFLVGGGSTEIGNMIIENLKEDIPQFVEFEKEAAITRNLIGYELASDGLGRINFD